MPILYKERIAKLISQSPFAIDPELKVGGRPPALANSEFLTNKEQGDWAEEIIYKAINQHSHEYLAVKYGRTEDRAAGEEGFDQFYQAYQDELNNIGKKPDLLIYRKSDVDPAAIDLDEDGVVAKAVAAIEVRSSSFLANRYAQFMESRSARAKAECERLRGEIMGGSLSTLLADKSPELYGLLSTARPETFRELDFRLRSWSSSTELRRLSDLLRQLKDQIRVLHRRDYLSITPKLEDLVLVNRWIQQFNVRHYYLQVFFDKAYAIAFKDILEICSDPSKEGVVFCVEEDVKNQGKTTIKVNAQVGKEILGRIDMPNHRSAMKELQRGRLFFYATFHGGRGYLDEQVFLSEVINDV